MIAAGGRGVGQGWSREASLAFSSMSFRHLSRIRIPWFGHKILHFFQQPQHPYNLQSIPSVSTKTNVILTFQVIHIIADETMFFLTDFFLLLTQIIATDLL
jgi:hypothetical protein